MIFLERKLIKYLDKKFLNGDNITRDIFINFIVEKKWPRINYYFWFKGKRFERKIENVLDDCVKHEYLNKEDGDSNVLKLSTRGRDFLNLLGFAEEYLKRRKRSVIVMLGILISILNFAALFYLTFLKDI